MGWVKITAGAKGIVVMAVGLSTLNPEFGFASSQEQGFDDIESRLLVFPRNKSFEGSKISFTVVKKRTGSFLFWKRHESYLEWEGANGDVVIYHSVSCPGGFTGRRDCKSGLKKVSTGKASGKFSYAYHPDDYFRVCEVGVEMGNPVYIFRRTVNYSDYVAKRGCSKTLRVPHSVGRAHHV